MAKAIKVEALGQVLGEQLTIYGKEVTEKVDAASENAVKKLAQRTKATAPRGVRGSYRKNITSGVKHKTNRGTTFVWYVKAPDYRLTHLLVKGHETRNGKRTKANPFLQNALDEVLPEYEKAVEEAVK
jgi:hypothetical protein